MTQRITFVGFGAMGQALFKGAHNALPDVMFGAVDPNLSAKDFQVFDRLHCVCALDDLEDHISQTDLFVFAVKPQIADAVCQQWQSHISDNSVVLSIAAGVSLEKFEKYFGDSQALIRAMPNTPAMVGKGVTGVISNSNVSEDQKVFAGRVLDAAGPVLWLDREDQIDSVTAISGSGPAYYFYITEVLKNAAVDLGFSEEQASILARHTHIGSGALLEASKEVSVEEQRIRVTSPGGTTAAALGVLQDGRLEAVIKEAVHAARDRSIELG